MNNSSHAWQRILELGLLASLPIFSLIAFSGLNLYWVDIPYDAWRIYEIFILFGFGLFLVCYRDEGLDLFNDKTHFWLKNTLFIIAILVVLSCYFAKYPQRAIADAALYFLLAVMVYTQAILLKKYPAWAEQIAAWLAVLPMLSLIFLPIALFDIWHGRFGDWSQSFSNIRIMDDALLPCLFLLWMRPAWLTTKLTQSKWANFSIQAGVLIISTLYLLSFLFHGARAAILAIMIGLFTMGILHRITWRTVSLPLCSAIIASSLFFVCSLFHLTVMGGSALIRNGSSERTEIWQKSINLWLEHPILGVGGDHFVLFPPYMPQAHPHNLLFQWLGEWGIAGILAICILVFLGYRLSKNCQKIPHFLLAALIALIVDALLSGILMYPVSQLFVVFILAWAIAQQSSHRSPQKIHQQKKEEMFRVMTILAILGLFIVHYQDLFCQNEINLTEFEHSPRFWQSGKIIHICPTQSP